MIYFIIFLIFTCWKWLIFLLFNSWLRRLNSQKDWLGGEDENKRHWQDKQIGLSHLFNETGRGETVEAIAYEKQFVIVVAGGEMNIMKIF